MMKNTGLKHKCGTLLDRDNVAGYVFILPFIIGLVVFTAIPFFTSLYLAFTKYNVLSDPKWVGLANFKEMFFEDELFWTSFKVTFKFALIQVPVKLTVALLVAMVLARATRVTSFYRAAFYIPSLMGGSVAIALLWKQLFSPKGVINQFWASSAFRMIRHGLAIQNRAGNAHCAGRLAVRFFDADFSGGH